MTSPLISIIVPVYNVEKYLDRCVESIVNQTYKNLEIILVDDGSPDNCPQMCDAWAEKDNRIRVIHKENGGVSSARNAGLEIALGDCIGFVDGDDYADEDMYKILVEQLYLSDAEISRCSNKRILENSKNTEYIKNDKTISVKSSAEYLVDFFNDTILNGSCCFKLYKKEVIGNIRFLEGYKIGEDSYFNYQVIKKAEKIVLINNSLYNYLIESDNSITSSNNISAWIHNFELHKKIFNEEKDNVNLASHSANTNAAALLNLYALNVKTNGGKEYSNQLDKILSENYSSIIKLVTNKKYKQRLFILKHLKCLYLLVLSLKFRWGL